MGQNIDLGHGSWVMEGLSRPDETYRRSVSKGRKKNGYCEDIFTTHIAFNFLWVVVNLCPAKFPFGSKSKLILRKV